MSRRPRRNGSIVNELDKKFVTFPFRQRMENCHKEFDCCAGFWSPLPQFLGVTCWGR